MLQAVYVRILWRGQDYVYVHVSKMPKRDIDVILYENILNKFNYRK